MKIIIIGTAYPYRGGLAAFNERLAREFVAEGHDVKMMTFTLQYPNFLFPGKTQYSEENPPRDLCIERCIHSVNPFNWIKVGRQLKKEKADWVVFAYWMSFFAPCFGTIARLARRPDTRMVALVHNMIPHEPTLLDKLFPRYFINGMDRFVALSASVADDIDRLDRHRKPKAVSPHPVYDNYGALATREEAAEKLGLRTSDRYLLFFGFIRRYKGLDLLLDALADPRLKTLPVKLLVAGEFYDKPEFYLNKIKALRLEDRVILHSDFSPDDRVRYYFSLADMVVQPYRSATQSGVSQIAYHFEKPILVTKVGGLPEIVPDRKVGYVVDIDPERIADALVDFYTHGRAAEFAPHIKEEKKKYLWSCMTEKIMDKRRSL